jgi:hypothetical protein
LNGVLVDQLRDIRGLDPVSWWPLATGWLLVAGIVLLLLFLSLLLIRHLHRYPPGSWRRDAQQQLRNLRHAIRTEAPKVVAGELSELLRRISIARFGRSDCASLTGEEWLAWLAETDPNRVEWDARGAVLLRLPYSKEGTAEDARAVDDLIYAAIRLVGNSREDIYRRPRWPLLRRLVRSVIGGEGGHV